MSVKLIVRMWLRWGFDCPDQSAVALYQGSSGQGSSVLLLLSKINHQHIDCYENQDFKSFAVMKARHSELCKNLMDPVNFINIKCSMKFM